MNPFIHDNLQLVLTVALGVAVALPVLLLNIKLAPRLGLVDWPKARGLSEVQVPIIGHSLVLISLAYLGGLAYLGKVSGFFVASTAIIATMGYLDDVFSRPALDKIWVQLFCVICIVLFDPALQQAITKPFGPWGTFWGIFFILGLMNAINFIDGIDGLAGTVLFFGSLGLYLFSFDNPTLRPISLYGALLAGMILPFLYLNIIPRKGFLGNVGSYTLSYILAVGHLSLPMDSSNIISRLALPGLCFLVPIADASMVLIYRLGARRSPFQADKGHLHHRLMQSSLPLRYILLVLGAIEALGVLIAFLLSEFGTSLPSWLAPSICFTQAVTVAMMVVLVEKTSKRRVQNYFTHLDQGKPVYFLKYRVTDETGNPLPSHFMHRLEARINTEIRISDLCFLQEPDTLFLTLRNLNEPFKGFSSRMERIFEQERVEFVLSIERGEFIKVSDSAHPEQRFATLIN